MKSGYPALTGLLALTTGVNAAVFTVTRTDDPVSDGCVANDCSLREAIIDANETTIADSIFLPEGTYLIGLSGNDTDVTGDLDVTSDITITGPAILDGQMQGRIMDIRNDAAVTLRDLRFQNANTSPATNGTSNGGALQIDGGSLNLRAVEFISNSANGLGGALYTSGNSVIDIRDSAFVNNLAATGAAVFTNVGITVSNTLFDHNIAQQRAGALYLSGTTASTQLNQVTLNENSGFGSGGGAVIFLGANLVINNLLATDNQSPTGNGGVIAVTGTGHAKSISISSAIFAGNSAENGAVMSFVDDGDRLEVSHAAVLDNRVSGRGGAFYQTGGTVDISNTTFSGNVADIDAGALFNSSGNLSLRHVTITGGSAVRGDALLVNGVLPSVTLSVANSLIDGECQLTSDNTVTSGGGNLEGPGNSCALSNMTDQTNLDSVSLGVSELRTNAGATPTHELSGASVARGAGVSSVCAMFLFDQIFNPRNSQCNAGAVESNTLFKNSFEQLQAVGSNVSVAL